MCTIWYQYYTLKHVFKRVDLMLSVLTIINLKKNPNQPRISLCSPLGFVILQGP